MAIADIILENKLMSKKDLDRILDPKKLTKPSSVDRVVKGKIQRNKYFKEFVD